MSTIHVVYTPDSRYCLVNVNGLYRRTRCAYTRCLLFKRVGVFVRTLRVKTYKNVSFKIHEITNPTELLNSIERFDSDNAIIVTTR